MSVAFEDLRVLQNAEGVADAIWKQVGRWDTFARDVVGKQLARAADSVGANIAEAFGRYHYGEKLNFLYYARGSLYETKYWLNRALARNLMPPSDVQEYASQLTNLACQLNALAASTRKQRGKQQPSRAMREADAEYFIDDLPEELFTETDLEWLRTIPPLND